MFRSDRDALAQEVEDLRRERAQLQNQNEAMRADLLSRRATSPSSGSVNAYKAGVAHLTPGERVALAEHRVEAFPVWAAVVLHFVTFGIFSLVHFSQLHDRLPKAEHDDPTAGKAIGFTFIPYFNFYWIVFNTLRLTDRINLQFRLRGLPDAIPRGLMMLTAVTSLIPYLNVPLAFFVMWPIAVAVLQRAANTLAALPQEGAVAEGSAEAWGSASAAVPPLRVPRVQDLPGPADVVEQDAEIEADEAASPHRAVR